MIGDRDAIRSVVIAAAARGLRGRRRSRRNPHYKTPSKASGAWTHLYGTARAFIEWATDDNIALAIAGLNERADNQAANIRAINECAARFTTIATTSIAVEADNPPTGLRLVEYEHGHQPTSDLRRLITEWTRASEQDQAAFLEWVSGQ